MLNQTTFGNFEDISTSVIPVEGYPIGALKHSASHSESADRFFVCFYCLQAPSFALYVPSCWCCALNVEF